MRKAARPVSPNAVGILCRHKRMKPGVGRDGPPRHDVAFLGKELVPPLLGKNLPRRSALHGPPSGDRIDECWVGRVGSEVGMIRQPPGRQRLPTTRRKRHVAGGRRIRSRHAGQRLRRLHSQSREGLCEFLRAEQRACWCTGRNRREGTAGKGAETVL